MVGPSVGGCPIFPADHALNQRVDAAPIHPRSALIMARFTPWAPALFAIKPYNVVGKSTPRVPVTITRYGKRVILVPIPPKPLMMNPMTAVRPNGNLDNHALFIDTDAGECFELWGFSGVKVRGVYTASSGYMYDLKSAALPPKGPTAAASGISVLAGLARADEILAGEIAHALAVTTRYTSDGCIDPATTWQRKRIGEVGWGSAAEWANADNPYMGTRIRLKESYDFSALGPQTRAILTAARDYGLIVTDGSKQAGQLYSDPHKGLDARDLRGLRGVPVGAFEVVDTGAGHL